MESQLLDPTSPGAQKRTLSKTVSLNNQHSYKTIYSIAEKLASKSILARKDARLNTKVMRISNILCFA